MVPIVVSATPAAATTSSDVNRLIAERRALQSQAQGLLDTKGTALEALLGTRDRLDDLRRQLDKNSAALGGLSRRLQQLQVIMNGEENRLQANKTTLSGIARQQYESSGQTAVSQVMFGSTNFDQVMNRIVANRTLSSRAHTLVVALREEQSALSAQATEVQGKQAEVQKLQVELSSEQEQLNSAATDYQARIDALDTQSHDLLDQVNQLDTAIAAAIGPPPPGGQLARVQVIAVIRAAALRWSADPDQLVRVATCESGLNPRAYHPVSGASGLFQFLPGTFYAHGGHDIWSAADQSDIAAKMFSQGLAYMWTCR